MIYDCFTFFNELDLLEIRLNVLKDVVDKFVLVEAGETHTGKPKAFVYDENKARFAAFADRMIYVRIASFPQGFNSWERECHQRNEILRGLVAAEDDDVVMISDLDEIPRPEIVAEYARKPGVWTFNMRSFGFYLNWEDVRSKTMCGTKMLSCHDLKTGFDGMETFYNEFLPPSINSGTTVSKIRRREFPGSKGGEKRLRNSGWHFTCLGGAEAILTKMKAVAPHAGFDPEDPSLTVEKINALLAKGQGPALKMNCFAVPIDSTYPRYLLENLDRYSHLVFAETPEYRRNVRWARIGRTVQGRWIQLFERIVPARLHNLLHVIRVRFTKGKKRG